MPSRRTFRQMEGKGQYREKMADDLKLTTEQRALVKVAVEKAKPEWQT